MAIVNNLEVVKTCPLGSVCREVKDGKIHQCMWLVEIQGENPQTGEQDNREDCAIAFTPVAILENARWSRGTQSAVESERNEIHKLNQVFETIIQKGNRDKKINGGSGLYLEEKQ
jgi:hypothetical protein